jgi:alpha-amylase
MSKVCFYFQVHQPYRLRDIRFGEIGGDLTCFDDEKNAAVFRKVAEKCYLPANALMLELLQKHPEFKIAYSLSGVFLDQCEEYGQDVLDSFRALARTGRVEFLAETYQHSLAVLKSLEEFCEQVRMQMDKVEALFGKRPTVFRNTELIYSNEIAHVARLMGFEGIIAEGADHLLSGRSPNVPFVPPCFRLPRRSERVISRLRPHGKRSEEIQILLKNYRLSDDIAFRFSNRDWVSYPLYAGTFAQWVADSGGHCVNLFMDYETFGEHQWADTGIFDFLRALPDEFKKRGLETAMPSEVIRSWKDTKAESPVYDAHAHVSWADTERDLSAWLGNHIQRSALDAAFALETSVKATGDADLIRIWRRLLTSDHLYYMCTKYWQDGDVHKYFSPYDSPYEAYRRFSHALRHVEQLVMNSERTQMTQRTQKTQKNERVKKTPLTSHSSDSSSFESSESSPSS